mmetsp:Transcript_5888/g.36498  ORF Transcript_5888/g.36498 Transcript_5888/m.36498 type:complete len:117 (-) Transcript_5888:1-351(-)
MPNTHAMLALLPFSYECGSWCVVASVSITPAANAAKSSAVKGAFLAPNHGRSPTHTTEAKETHMDATHACKATSILKCDVKRLIRWCILAGGHPHPLDVDRCQTDHGNNRRVKNDR